MEYMYIGREGHAVGEVLSHGPYQLISVGRPDLYEEHEPIFLVQPLGATIAADLGDVDLVEAEQIKIIVAFASGDLPDLESSLPSRSFDCNPALDSFLGGNPSPRFVEDGERLFLVMPVGIANETTIYGLTEVSRKRAKDIRSRLLTFRQAFRYSRNPVFLTQEFSSYSLRTDAEFGHGYLPAKGRRYGGLSRKERARRQKVIKRTMKRWTFGK